MRATLQQYLHDFEASVASLRLLLARPGEAGRAQAWLTLATVLRVQGRYAESDEACRGVAAAGARCMPPPAGPRTRRCAARSPRPAAASRRLLAQPGLPPATQGWLLTSLAELEERERRSAAADAAYRASWRSAPTPMRRSPMPIS